MTTGGCGCAATIPPMTGGGYKKKGGGGELYLSQLVNLAIPVGFVFARNALSKINSPKKDNQVQQTGGQGYNSDFASRIQNVSFRIQNFLKQHRPK